jgi:hypothetical protein
MNAKQNAHYECFAAVSVGIGTISVMVLVKPQQHDTDAAGPYRRAPR